MCNTNYKFDELVDMMRNKPKTFLYIYYATMNYFEIMNKAK